MTLSGIVTEVKPVQPSNADSPIAVTSSPKTNSVTWSPNICLRFESFVYVFEAMALLLSVTFVKLVQPLNALVPIEVMLLGIVTAVKPVHPLNAFFPIEVTAVATPLYSILLGMTNSPE